jgi:DNA replication and repair protein RecF
LGYFKNISFTNYRNFSKFHLDFGPSSNIIFGKNGSGKTNILEGISLFEKGRGLRKEKIYNLINFNNKNNEFKINTIFENQKTDLNISVYSLNQKLKKLAVNNSSENNSIKHFESLFSIIYFLPEMERLFVAPPSMRRNFLDRLIFTFNKDYNLTINNYKKSII